MKIVVVANFPFHHPLYPFYLPEKKRSHLRCLMAVTSFHLFHPDIMECLERIFNWNNFVTYLFPTFQTVIFPLSVAYNQQLDLFLGGFFKKGLFWLTFTLALNPWLFKEEGQFWLLTPDIQGQKVGSISTYYLYGYREWWDPTESLISWVRKGRK